MWDTQGVGNTVLFLKEFSERVKDMCSMEWEESMAQSSKLYLLRSLKPSGIKREQYLHCVTIRKYRRGLAKLRCSAHDLAIEKGRHKGQLVADRVCKLCLQSRGAYVLEDEFHFTMCCSQFSDLRVQYFPEWARHTNSYTVFLQLLLDEDEEIVKNVASYVYQANKLRQALLKATEICCRS